MNDLKSTIDFSIIRYANCWEDPLILAEGLMVKSGEKVLSIASAGDNSFFLLMNEPEIVVAADVNQVQLFLVELKAAALRLLEREDYLAFAGFHEGENRLKTFTLLRDAISIEARSYWDKQSDIIKEGIIYAGKFEKYFQLFSGRILPFIHTKKRIHNLFAEKSSADQIQFYQKIWNNRRWRLFFSMFFSRYIMGKYGRDPEFLKEVNMSVSEFIFRQAATHLSQVGSQHNFILHFNLNGNFGNEMPPYILVENYERIRGNLKQLRIYSGYAQNAAKVYGKFHKLNLSDIFEYMDKPTFEGAGAEMVTILHNGGRMAYWNLMVPRRISSFSQNIFFLEKLSGELTKKDKGFFYNKFIVEEKNNS